jgi:ketosteroid isomerase-like protein
MSEHLRVKEVNARFYDALSSQNMEEMDTLWLHEAWTKCVHPGWEILVGWKRIRDSWANIFRNAQYLKINISNLSIEVKDEIAWVVCTENIASAHDANYQVATAQATNIYYRVNNEWFLVHHHASPVTVDTPLEASETIQ